MSDSFQIIVDSYYYLKNGGEYYMMINIFDDKNFNLTFLTSSSLQILEIFLRIGEKVVLPQTYIVPIVSLIVSSCFNLGDYHNERITGYELGKRIVSNSLSIGVGTLTSSGVVIVATSFISGPIGWVAIPADLSFIFASMLVKLGVDYLFDKFEPEECSKYAMFLNAMNTIKDYSGHNLKTTSKI